MKAFWAVWVVVVAVSARSNHRIQSFLGTSPDNPARNVDEIEIVIPTSETHVPMGKLKEYYEALEQANKLAKEKEDNVADLEGLESVMTTIVSLRNNLLRENVLSQYQEFQIPTSALSFQEGALAAAMKFAYSEAKLGPTEPKVKKWANPETPLDILRVLFTFTKSEYDESPSSFGTTAQYISITGLDYTQWEMQSKGNLIYQQIIDERKPDFVPHKSQFLIDEKAFVDLYLTTERDVLWQQIFAILREEEAIYTRNFKHLTAPLTDTSEGSNLGFLQELIPAEDDLS
eukprot:Platyproteum_vivax@DN16377_c0_g1_i1.p1